MSAKQMSLGGITAGLAIVILCLGGLIPLATYILPMFCCILLQLIMPTVGYKGGWVWYSAVSLLAVMLCPDKEAAVVWVILGWYPLIKPKIDQIKWALILKLLIFNGTILIFYQFLIHLLGLASVAADFKEMDIVMTAITLILGNICFLLLDMVLAKFSKIKPGA